jgi:hypothetical protein
LSDLVLGGEALEAGTVITVAAEVAASLIQSGQAEAIRRRRRVALPPEPERAILENEKE